MQTLKSTTIFLPLLIFSLLHFTSADPLYTSCSDSAGNYSTNHLYAKSLDQLLNSLLNNVPPTGYGIATAGQEAHGLALCRGDISPAACKTCVGEASKNLRRECPTQKEAITWYDNCMVRYAARNFFGTVEDGFRVFVWNTAEVPDPATFNQKVVNLLKRVSSEAYGNAKTLFGTEEADVVVSGKKEKLYSHAQCTRDVNAGGCKRCLQDIIADLPNCCNGKRGGRVLAASCNFRYELYPFY